MASGVQLAILSAPRRRNCLAAGGDRRESAPGRNSPALKRPYRGGDKAPMKPRRRAWLTSSACVQMIACGPWGITTCRAPRSSPGSRFPVTSGGVILSWPPRSHLARTDCHGGARRS
jgi:hypothetical protein